MAYSDSQWPVIASWGDSRLGPVKFLVGSKVMRKGDVAWIFSDFNQRYNDTIDRLGAVGDDWGHNPRKIAGTNIFSRHARAIAQDLNASKHPMFYDTMSASMEGKIRALVKRYGGAIRWGGDYGGGRIDQMHFEINCSPAQLRAIVARLQAGGVAPTATKPRPRPAVKAWPDVNLVVDGDFGKVTRMALQEMLKGIDLYDGKIDGDFGPMTRKAMQAWLSQTGFYKGKIDGDFAGVSIDALQRFLKDRGFYPGNLDKDWGGVTTKGLQGYLNKQRKYFD